MTPALEFPNVVMQTNVDQLQRTAAEHTARFAPMEEEQEPVREKVELVAEQQPTYEANAEVAQTSEETLGSVIDLIG